VPGLSDGIRVISIVDRYLEHARVFVFDNAGEPEYETAFPILDCRLQRRLRDILDTQLADTVKARLILPDGRSSRVTPGDEPPLRSQERLYALAAPAGEL